MLTKKTNKRDIENAKENGNKWRIPEEAERLCAICVGRRGKGSGKSFECTGMPPWLS